MSVPKSQARIAATSEEEDRKYSTSSTGSYPANASFIPANKSRTWSGPTQAAKVFTQTVAGSNMFCAHCNSTEHSLEACRRFRGLMPEDRRKIVLEKNACFRCLGVGHRARECTTRKVCSCGDARHHQYLHETSFAARRGGTGAAAFPTNATAGVSAPGPAGNSWGPSTAAGNASGGTSSMLHPAPVPAPSST